MGYHVKFGAVLSEPDVRDYRLSYPKAEDFPDEFTIDDPPDVLNQGDAGQCVACVWAAIAQWWRKKQKKLSDKMSKLCIYGNRRHTDYKNVGMPMREAGLNVKKEGVCLESLMPGNKEVPEAIEIFEANYDSVKEDALLHIFTDVVTLQSVSDIKHYLVHYGPIGVVVNWYGDMKYKGGIVDSLDKIDEGSYHAILIYGWEYIDGKLYWKMQNSWGTSWGNKGRALLSSDIPFRESYAGIDEYIEGDSSVKPYNSGIGKIIAAILNFIIKLFRR